MVCFCMDYRKNIGQVEYAKVGTKTFKLVQKVAHHFHWLNASRKALYNWIEAEKMVAHHYREVDDVEVAIGGRLAEIRTANAAMCLNELDFNFLTDEIFGSSDSGRKKG